MTLEELSKELNRLAGYPEYYSVAEFMKKAYLLGYQQGQYDGYPDPNNPKEVK